MHLAGAPRRYPYRLLLHRNDSGVAPNAQTYELYESPRLVGDCAGDYVTRVLNLTTHSKVSCVHYSMSA